MERLTRKLLDGTAYTGAVMDADIAGVNYPTYIGKAVDKLAAYEDAEEQGKLRLPCEVGDAVYLIDKDENDRLQVYEGKWRRVSLVQTSKSSSFELCGEISYDKHDCFYNDGRTMEQGMYVGQESTKIGEVVFLTREQAEAKLKELEGEQWKD